MTTERETALSRRDLFVIRRARKKQFEAAAQQVKGFGDLGGATGQWVMSDPGQPKLFARDPASLERDLAELWSRHGREQLLALAPTMDGLASRVRKRPLQSGEEISSDLYAMQ